MTIPHQTIERGDGKERERDWKRAGRLLAFNVGRGRKINIFDCCYPDPPSLYPSVSLSDLIRACRRRSRRDQNLNKFA